MAKVVSLGEKRAQKEVKQQERKTARKAVLNMFDSTKGIAFVQNGANSRMYILGYDEDKHHLIFGYVSPEHKKALLGGEDFFEVMKDSPCYHVPVNLTFGITEAVIEAAALKADSLHSGQLK